MEDIILRYRGRTAITIQNVKICKMLKSFTVRRFHLVFIADMTKLDQFYSIPDDGCIKCAEISIQKKVIK